MKKIVYLGAKDIAARCLEWLIRHSNEYQGEIIAVGTKDINATNPLIRLAEDNKLPVISHQDDIPECDYIISVQYHDILSADNIRKAKILPVNLHLAPIPEYRGCNQFSFAIFNEEEAFGVTLHKINTRIDHGEIIDEFRFPISKDIWVKDLWALSNEYGYELFKRAMPQILNKTYSTTDWTTLNRTERIYYRKDINRLKQIDLDQDSIPEIKRKIRACSMPGFPPPYSIINNIKINMTAHESTE